ncbi:MULTISPECIES: hypothetical protein [Aerosakkonemataceae]|uniref:ParE-like toxin domain-containing protein n=1 Tax=[Phormidium ambiguum] IAM M-71 TaxID=454136 RepID=A0A1U7I5K6_9CYAN|nr:hypothetical protein [Phormidium ambiguum]OKH31549.1 hypothetical protein NIES2119_28500 [Phormidium ambiguum IAM M-71]
MKSLTTSDFWKAYAALSPEMKQQARKVYQLWKQNQFHPSLHFKKVGKNLWSVRITEDYRALALKKGDDYYWLWIGSHDEYDALLN